MFDIKLDNSKDIIEFLKLPLIVGLKVTITYNFGFEKTTGVILKNEKDWITIQIPYDTFTITKNAILTLELKKSDYTFVNKFTVNNNNEFELGDMVEIINVDGLNRVLYNKYPKGGKELIGLQGKITMIDKISCKNITYYFVDLPESEQYRYINLNCIEDNRTVVFLEDNLKLVKEGKDKLDNSRFFNPSNIKALDYKDLDGKTLKITVVDNEECLLVAGVDKENNKIYMLHSEVK